MTHPTDALRTDLLTIVQSAIRAADPATLVTRALAHDRASNDSSPVWLIAVGKASPTMASAASEILGDALTAGVVITPNSAPVKSPLRVMVAEHPQPGTGSEAAGLRALEIARAVPRGERLLVLLSGGASSLMAVPASGITLEEKRRATAVLLKSGADIYALNTVRKHLSAIKGGRLAVATQGECHALAISDVVGDDLSFIGSGPTVGDASTFADARRVIGAFGGAAAYPASVVAHLDAGLRGEQAETPKPGDRRLERSTAAVVGGRFNAMRGAADAARARGYDVAMIEAPLVGEARIAAPEQIDRMIATARTLRRPACVISSGETTVTVTGEGRGGRNQELALASARALDMSGTAAALASVGTDGVDGPTDAAGAVVDTSTISRAAAARLPSIESYLHDNNAYAFFEAIGDLIRTGPTGTNVGDLQILLLA